MAYVFAPDGTPGEVPDEQLAAAVEQGFRLREATPAEVAKKTAAEQPLQAGLEGVARGFTGGFGESLVRNLEAEFASKPETQVAEEMRLRREMNPAAAFAGEVGGMVGSFAAGPAGLVSKGLGGLRGAGLAGRVAAGAAEGTLWGIGQAVSESVLDDTELTGEQLAAAAASGALTGGALEGAFAGIGKGTSMLVKKAGGSSLSDMLGKAGDALSLSMIESKKWAKKYGVFEDDILRVAREEGVLSKATALDQASVELAKKGEQRVWGEINNYIEGAQYFDPMNPQDAWNYVQGKLKDYDRNPVAKNALERVQGYMDQLITQGATWGDLWTLQRTIREGIEQGASPIVKDVLGDARIAMRDYILENAPKKLAAAQNAPDLGAKFKDAVRRYAALDAFEKGLADATAGYESRGVMGFKEWIGGQLAANIAGGGVPGAVGAGAAYVAGKWARKKGGFIAGEALREMADSNITQGIAKSFAGRVNTVLQNAPEMLGPFRATLESAAARGAMDLLETHVQLAQSTQGAAYMATLGLSPETPEEVEAAGQKAAYLMSAQSAAREYQLGLLGAADGLLGTRAGRPSTGAGSTLSAKEFDKTMESIRGILSNPDAAFQKIPAEMLSTLPNTSGSMATTLLRGAQFLDSKAPKSPFAGMPISVAPPWEPSAADLDKFNRYKEAVETPAKVLKNMANGYIAPEQVEALQAVYPRMYADLQQRLGERLMELKKPLTYQQKMALQPILGAAALGMSPQQMQVLQEQQALAWQAKQGQGMSKPDGRQRVDQEANIDTQAQRLARR